MTRRVLPEYASQQSPILFPEYGRTIQEMIDHAITIKSSIDRQRCAESIIRTMTEYHPTSVKDDEFKQMLWEHLALMSQFRLDVLYPFVVKSHMPQKAEIQKVEYPKSKVNVLHYGKFVFDWAEIIKCMSPSPERVELIHLVLGKMKNNIEEFYHEYFDDSKIVADLSSYIGEKLPIDRIEVKHPRLFEQQNNNIPKLKKKKKK